MIALLANPLALRFMLIAGVLVALVIGANQLGRLHGRAVADYRDKVIMERDAHWRLELNAAEDKARARIAEQERVGYRAGVAAEQQRAAADSAAAEHTNIVIKEVMRVSPTAATCDFDDPTARALNSLRGPT